MLEPQKLTSIRQRIGLTQEQMARLLGVSFASVNRWEGGHSGPSGSILDLYAALDSALAAGYTPEAIKTAADNQRGTFLLALFKMAYSKARNAR